MIKKRIHRIRFIFSLLSFFLVPQLVLAIVYQPGETLSPDCVPTDTSCFVQRAITGTAASSTFQTKVIFSDIVTILSTTTPSSVENVLYNSGSTLFWNGVAVSLASSTISSMNGLGSSTQLFAIGNSGTDFNIVSTSTTHTFNIPDAGITSRGVISTTTQSFAGDKTFTGTLTFATTTATGLTISQNGLTISSSTPFATSSSLYNLGNTLYWNGSEVLTMGLACGCATGWLTGGAISINSGDATKIDITAGSARIVDISNPLSPDIQTITWEDQTAFDPTLTGRSKWIGVQDNGSGGATFVSDVAFDSVERRSTAILGRIWTTAGTGPTITNVAGYQRPAWGIVTAFQDFVLEFGSWNISGNVFTANGANLLLNKSSGTSYRYHTESTYGQENVHIDAVQTGITTYNYHVQGSAVTYSRSALEPAVRSTGSGATTTVTDKQFTRQEVYYFPVSGTVHVLYGQTEYATLAAAEAAGIEGVDPVNLDILDGSIHRASIILKEDATSLTDTTRAKIINITTGLGGAQQFSGYWSTNTYGIFFHENGLNVGIGTSTSVRKLHVVSTSTPPARFQNNSGYCDIDPTNTLLICTSDARLKTNVQTIKNTLDGILALNPVNFDWKSQVGDGEEGVRGSHYGLIAQEVEEIFPHLVSTDEETGLKSVGYGGLMIPMLKTLQDIALISSMSAATSTIAEDGSLQKTFLGKFFDRMIAWFADTANGIGKLFAESVDTHELCLTDQDGTSCYSRSDLNTALGSSGTSQTQSAIVHTSSSSNDSSSVEAATTTSSSTPPSDNVSPDIESTATTTNDSIPTSEGTDSSTEVTDTTTSSTAPPEPEDEADPSTEVVDTTIGSSSPPEVEDSPIPEVEDAVD